MTDKEKIREEVEKIAKSINPFLPDEDGKNSEYEAGRFAMVTQIMQIIDSMQEEPVSNPIDFEKELYKAFGQVKDFTLGMRIAKWFYDKGKKSQEPVSEGRDIFDNCLKSEEKFILPQKISGNINCENCLYSSACALGDIKACIIDKPVSEDLGEYINELSKQFPKVSFAKLSRIAVRVAKWQITKLMKDATEVTVHIDAGGYPYTPEIELYDYDKDVPLAKEGDKYKVVLIKEE